MGGFEKSRRDGAYCTLPSGPTLVCCNRRCAQSLRIKEKEVRTNERGKEKQLRFENRPLITKLTKSKQNSQYFSLLKGNRMSYLHRGSNKHKHNHHHHHHLQQENNSLLNEGIHTHTVDW